MTGRLAVLPKWSDLLRLLPKLNPDYSNLGEYIRRVLALKLPPHEAREVLRFLEESVVAHSALRVVVYPRCACEATWEAHIPWRGQRLCPNHEGFAYTARVADYGLVSNRVVTTAGVGFIVDAFQNLKELENFKYHALGTGSTAEASGDTALVTELTTQYAADNTRPTGTTTEGASANVYRTVATNTLDASATIAEHGIFDQAATGGGVLLDRSLTGSVVLASGDGLQSTYDLTFSAGG